VADDDEDDDKIIINHHIMHATFYQVDFLIKMHLDSCNTNENTMLPPYLNGYPLKHEEYSGIWVIH
jgi:hypothetical protein